MSNNTKWDEIAAQLLASIEEGRPPWQRDWKSPAGTVVAFWPTNVASGKPYRGCNAMILLYQSQNMGWADLRFLTFNQARVAGGMVRKGEKGTSVFLFLPMVKLPSPLNSKIVWSADDPVLLKAFPGRLPAGTERFGVQRGYTVFNVTQVDGLPSVEASVETVEAPEGTDPACGSAHQLARLCAGSVLVKHGHDTPAYAPGSDLVLMPERKNFETQSGYYAALFHEFSHASGSPKRLNRDAKGTQDSVAYAIEELVAESGAAFVTASVGLSYQSQHADYLAEWARNLRKAFPNPADVLMRAFGAGQKAADCVLAGLPDAQAAVRQAA